MDIAIRSLVAFLFVFAITRVVGRVDNGSVIERNLRRERLTVGEVEAEARQQQLVSLGQIRWAMLERNGRISFIPGKEGTGRASSWRIEAQPSSFPLEVRHFLGLRIRFLLGAVEFVLLLALLLLAFALTAKRGVVGEVAGRLLGPAGELVEHSHR